LEAHLRILFVVRVDSLRTNFAMAPLSVKRFKKVV